MYAIQTQPTKSTFDHHLSMFRPHSCNLNAICTITVLCHDMTFINILCFVTTASKSNHRYFCRMEEFLPLDFVMCNLHLHKYLQMILLFNWLTRYESTNCTVSTSVFIYTVCPTESLLRAAHLHCRFEIFVKQHLSITCIPVK